MTVPPIPQSLARVRAQALFRAAPQILEVTERFRNKPTMSGKHDHAKKTVTQKTIRSVSYYPVLGNLKENLENILEICEDTDSQKANVVFFPELAASGYLLENLTAETAVYFKKNGNDINYFHPDPEIHSLLQKILFSSKNKEIIFGCVARLYDHRLYNAIVVLSKERILHVQAKIYPPTYGMFDESRYFSKGNKLAIYDGACGRSGILICEDAWHPALAYALYQQGAEHIFVPSASPARGVTDENLFRNETTWRNRLAVYTESFHVFFHYLNRSGAEDGVLFSPEIFYTSPGGIIEIPDFEANNRYTNSRKISTYVVHNEELARAFTAGGPACEENFDLNLRLIKESFRNRVI